MNNEPTYIAGILQEEALGRGQVFWLNKPKDGTHLYTHPAELTDEEIAGAVARGWCSEKNSMKEMDSDLAWAIVEELKAILRKAQEK